MIVKKILVWRDFLKSFGPGILFAGSAIGVSHLVQATRAGAEYGYSLMGIILLANLFKYPFFEFGARYANVTGESLIEGYRRLGKGFLWLFILLTLATMWIVLAAIVTVTAAMFSLFIDAGISLMLEAIALLTICSVVLFIGHYATLDKIMKGVILILVISTVAAVAVAFRSDHVSSPNFTSPSMWTGASLAFIIALMGWMPAPIDAAVWTSLWSLARQKQVHYHPSLWSSDIDFDVGYIASAVMAFCFMFLGASVMYGTGVVFSESGVGFAKQFTGIYVENLGEWTRSIITVTAFLTMFSTALSVTDAYARVLGRVYTVAFPHHPRWEESRRAYGVVLVALIVGVAVVINKFQEQMLALVDFATTISFVSNPLLAYMNLRIVALGHIPKEGKPPFWLQVLAYCGLVFIVSFSALYLWLRFL